MRTTVTRTCNMIHINTSKLQGVTLKRKYIGTSFVVLARMTIELISWFRFHISLPDDLMPPQRFAIRHFHLHHRQNEAAKEEGVALSF